VYSGEPIFGQYPDSRAALFSQDGALKHPGDPVVVPHLADSLERIARHGYQEFYNGELARHMADEFQREGGLLTLRDLAEYRPLLRKPLEISLDSWTIATNPPPAIGGSTLGAMLILAARAGLSKWGAPDVAKLIDIQHRVLDYRRRHLDLSQDLELDARQLVDQVLAGKLEPGQSGSTIHASVVDSAGNACAVTMSAGYGSGYLPRDTGIWMNNSLGELELNRRGLDMGPPGGRLPSNMAPTVARSADGASLAIGSPGADRITTAILHTLINYIHLDMPLQSAIDHPRVHVEWIDDKEHVATEPGLDMSQVSLPVRGFTKPSMYFGGVAAAVWHPQQGFTVAADSRRAGATATS
jgi:gamma-glutamyltranspeptidase/glutathione hydrolase